MSVSFTARDVYNATVAYVAAESFILGSTTALLVGASSFISFSKDIGMKISNRDLSPFRFVASMEKSMW